MGNQPDTKITWVIKEFSSLQSEEIYSYPFVVGSCQWYLLAHPKGHYMANNHFSMFLAVADSDFLPLGWRRYAKFSFTIVNQFSDELSLVTESECWFDQNAPNQGFTEMITLDELHAKEGFLMNGELIVVVKVDVLEVVGEPDVLEESSPIAVDVKGFQVHPSQAESVKRLFERHPDIASKFRPKNPYLKTAYMNVLLSLMETLSQWPQGISKDDLAEQHAALSYLTDLGFELGWLEKKLDEVKEKKEKEEACLARLQEMEEQLRRLKVELLEIRAPLSLYEDDDVV